MTCALSTTKMMISGMSLDSRVKGTMKEGEWVVNWTHGGGSLSSQDGCYLVTGVKVLSGSYPNK